MLQLRAQTTSPELQDKAVELLRQTISQERHATPMTSSAPMKSAPRAVEPSSAALPVMQPASSALQEQALARLRETITQERSHAATTPRSARPSKGAMNTPKTKAPVNQANHMEHMAAPETGSTTPAPAPAQPTGPRTKQQKLMDLLELYKADKLTPAEYHSQRAKILAEP
jgi:hypothetical protein